MIWLRLESPFIGSLGLDVPMDQLQPVSGPQGDATHTHDVASASTVLDNDL